MTDHRPPHPVDYELHEDSEPMSAANICGQPERWSDTIQLWLTAIAILAAAGLAVCGTARAIALYLGA